MLSSRDSSAWDLKGSFSLTRFSTKGEKFQHTKSVHKFGYKCGICSKVFDRPALLQRHLAKHTGKKPYKCSLCSYQTPNKANAKRHIEKKHSDVQEGSILFVTEDGEQIHLEVVAKNARLRDEDERARTFSSSTLAAGSSSSSSLASNPEAVSPSSSTSTLPRPPSATVTSATFTSPETDVYRPNFEGGIGIQGMMNLDYDYKRKMISHPIDKIMNQQQPEQHHPLQNESCPGNVISSDLGKGSNTSLLNPECFGGAGASCNHHNINEHHLVTYCSPNWSRSSSLLSVNNDYAACKPQHSLCYPSQSTFPYTAGFGGGAATHHPFSSSSPSLIFRQCVHGCWHHVDNHGASDSSPNPSSYATHLTSFGMPHFNHNPISPDLRSSSSISHRTENSSNVNQTNIEDDDDSDIIDVVGDCDGDSDDASRVQLLSSVCQGLHSFTTSEKVVPLLKEEKDGNKGETKIGCLEGPPVESLPRRSSSSAGSSSNPSDILADSAEEYVPKKLRVSRAYHVL